MTVSKLKRHKKETHAKTNQVSLMNQNQRWEDRFQQLVDFKKKYGHCCVSSSDKEFSQLCTWVRHQRHLYKLNRKGIPSSLTFERMSMLDSIDFVWDVATFDPLWNKRFQELVEFKKKNGHCNVTLRMGKYKELAKWVMNQRRAHRENRLVMLGDRKAKLDSINFEWHRNKYTWEESFEQLKKFKADHGHDDPPMDSTKYRRLRIWVQNQRTMHKLQQTRKKSSIIKERIKKLESINFRFNRKEKLKGSTCPEVGKIIPMWICDKCNPHNPFKYKSFVSLLAHDAMHYSS